MSARQAIAKFLAANPEAACEVKYHAFLGPLLTTKGVKLFTAWAESNGLTTPHKVESVFVAMDKALKEQKPEF